MSSSTGTLKLQEEYKKIRKNKVFAAIQGSVAPIEDDFLHWSGCFTGPKNTPYSDGTYYFEIKFPDDYPQKGLIDVQMRTKILHPNIDSRNGHICVSYFSNWKNTYNVVGIVNAIFDLLDEPNCDDGYLSTLDEKKATELNLKYATVEQEYDWKTSWNQGWIIDK
jgi:ubiquitin-protein ligase